MKQCTVRRMHPILLFVLFLHLVTFSPITVLHLVYVMVCVRCLKHNCLQKIAYGFGAKVKNKESNCFPCNFNISKPQVIGIKGISDAYQVAVGSVEPNANSSLHEMIQTATTIARASKENQYLVLLVFTNGESICDLTASAKLLLDSVDAPLSILFLSPTVEPSEKLQMLVNRVCSKDKSELY